jgi:hypothetical protein
MINIRYRDPVELSPGLHAAAERHGRTTTVYLLPGLTVAQRRAALRRLRISARRGYGPRLPAPQLALALAADRIRTTVGRAGAVFRSHPAGSTVPVMVLSAGAIAFLALSAVSIQVIHEPLRPPSLSGAAVGPGATVSVGPGASRRPGGQAGQAGQGRQAGQGAQGGPGGQPADQPASGSSPGGSAPGGGGSDPSSQAASAGAASPPAGATESGPGTTLGGGTQPTPSPTADPTTAPPPSSPVPRPSPPPTAGKTKTCLKLGPLGVCL